MSSFTRRGVTSCFYASAIAALLSLSAPFTQAGTVTIDTSAAGRMQVIDGFGTCMWNKWAGEQWFQHLYYDDLGASIVRMDLTPYFKPPVSDNRYNSPPIGSKGPDGNRVRTYTSPQDYEREFGGKRATVAIMGPDIAKNIEAFDYTNMQATAKVIQAGFARKEQLGDFKLYGSIWSPAPWVKMTSGGKSPETRPTMPAHGTPYPFIWNGEYAGGLIDVSNKPLEMFNDGAGPTSALTQFARCTAAYIKGFQDKFGVKLYAFSIQNELNFEEYYKSATYQLSSEYIAAVKAIRQELDKYPDLKDIQIAGPEDLLGGDAWSMWQIGGGKTPMSHKNLQYLQNIAADPDAAKAVSFFCIHGYAGDGGTAVGADSQMWDWWVNGWNQPPRQGLPAQVKGFSSYGKKSWMTETSGEADQWLAPAKGFPGNGGWSIAFKIQQALTAGRESACIYWQFAEPSSKGDPGATTSSCLTGKTNGDHDPKYIATKHFAKFIRPNSVAVKTSVAGDNGLTASAYVHDPSHALTIVLVTRTNAETTAQINIPADFAGLKQFSVVTSSNGSFWKPSTVPINNGQALVHVPGYGVVTLAGKL